MNRCALSTIKDRNIEKKFKTEKSACRVFFSTGLIKKIQLHDKDETYR